MWRVLWFACLLLLFSVNAAYPESGVTTPIQTTSGFTGRIILDGGPAAGARVYAYKSLKDVSAGSPYAVSGPTGEDGGFSLELPAGSWYIAGKKRQAGSGDGPVSAGELYGYHGSNPVACSEGGLVHIGINLTRTGVGATYKDIPDGQAYGILSGTVISGGRPVEGARVSVYLDGKDGFRGPGYAASPPTGSDGAFEISMLPETDYYVLARKRTTGKAAGPLAEGDLFGYYPANPVSVKAGKSVRLEFAVASKVKSIDRGPAAKGNSTRLTGRITTADGRPAKGVYVFSYLDKDMSHKRPERMSDGVDKDGRYTLDLPGGGTYFVGARSEYGDTPGIGEWYGRYEGTADHSVNVKAGEVVSGIDIVVERILQ